MATLSYGSQEFRQYVELAAYGTQGIDAVGDFLVAQRSAGANMSVDVAAGRAVVRGDTDTDEGLYAALSSATTNVSITAADGSNPRVDRVVLEIKNNEEDAGGLYVARIRTVDGTPTSGATLVNLNGAASVPSSCLLLANVLVAAGDTSITDSEIGNVAQYCLIRSPLYAPFVGVYKALGSAASLKAATMDPIHADDATGAIMADGTVNFHALVIPEAGTITGVWFVQQTAGNYTADTTGNQVGLYRTDGTTLTLIASCANDTTLWKAVADTPTQKAFTSSVAVDAGLYYVATAYNQTAETTAPVLYGAQASTVGNAMASFGLSGKRYGTVAGTSLPSTQALSGISVAASQRPQLIGLY
jgi:hypothetical protein